MALTATLEKLNNTEFADAVRTQALTLWETTQAKLEQAQVEGRTKLAHGVLVGAQQANNVSEFLAELAGKIAPPVKAKPRKPAAKAAVRTAAKRPARKSTKAA